MESLQEKYPPQISYPSPERGPLSTRRTVTIKPSTGTKVAGASTSDIVQFKLPNTGVLASCYLKGRVKVGTISAGTGTAAHTFAATRVVQDPFAPAASWIRRMVVKTSDGTEVTNVNNYHRYCSIKARLQNDEGYSENQGSILENTPTLNGANVQGGFNAAELSADAMVVGAAPISFAADHKDASKRVARAFAANNSLDFVHEFQAGILAANKNKDFFLPLALMGSGMSLELTCAEKEEVFRAVAPDTTVFSANPLDQIVRPGAGADSYELQDLELVCDLLFMDPQIMSSLASEMCSGLKVVVDNVRQQQTPVTQQSNTIILNQHARSVRAVIGGIKNTSDAANSLVDESEYYVRPADGSSALSKIQFSVGAENVPSNPITYGPQSYKELSKAFKGIVGDEFELGNQVRYQDYHKAYKSRDAAAGSGGAGARPGSALFGINLRQHPEMPEVVSGKSASAGSISMSMELEFDGGTGLAAAMVETFIISDSVVELLADGGALVSK
tara:strand:- start:3225 stop:4733 length:1509 start_codon:yes stop_codon:yes gene_type:complete